MNIGKRVYVKVYETPTGLLVAACDEDLLGIVLEDPERNIKIHVTPDFYKGRLVQSSELSRMLESADTANLVGEEAVNIAIESGLIHPSAVLRVKGVPIAYFARI